MIESSVAQERLQAFNDKLRKLDIQAYWMRPPREGHAEQPEVLKWKTIYPLLLEAGEVVRLDWDASATHGFDPAGGQRLPHSFQ